MQLTKEVFHFSPATPQDRLDEEYRRSGYSITTGIPALMRRNAAEFGSLTAVVDGTFSLTWRELVDRSFRFAGYLQSRGIGPGDVVLWQLPNWWEALVVAQGIWAVGAVSAPVVPIYRELELRTICEAVRPAALVVARAFHSTDHVELITRACDGIVEPSTRVVVRGAATGWTSFESALTARPFSEEGIDATAPALVAFTSGTTGGAKGVVHSTATLMSSGVATSRVLGFAWSDRGYMPGPLAHSNGLLSGVARPLATGCSIVLSDRWDPEAALDDMRRLGVSFSAGPTVFVQDLLQALSARGESRLELKSYPIGGSTVAPVTAYAADAAGMHPSRGWGMTECPAVTVSGSFEPLVVRCETDGRIAPGCEVRVVGDDGRVLNPGDVGELHVRGPQRALGYVDAADTMAGFDDEGWFRTGDLGRLSTDRTVTVTGRLKDIINRGGEKMSAREIEDLLLTHPLIAEAAVVPAPHARLGEQPAAYLVARGARQTPEELELFLMSAGLTKRKVPRIWRYVDEMPRTPSGKISKAPLADAMASEALDHRWRGEGA